jgi:hypothetical protein
MQVRSDLPGPAPFNPELRKALRNLSLRPSALNREEEALRATQGAIHLYKEVSEEQPGLFNADLSNSLNSLCIEGKRWLWGLRSDMLVVVMVPTLIKLLKYSPEHFSSIDANDNRQLRVQVSKFQ